MHNEILKIGKLTVHGYGLMIAIGILAAVAISIWRAKKKKMDPEPILDIVLIAMIGGFLGGKILYLIVDWKNFIASEDKMKYLGGSGFVVYGGIILGVAVCLVYFKFIKKLDFLTYMDLVMPQVSVAQGFGRIGCFLAGCCYGAQTNSAIGVIFPEGSLAPAGVKLWPTQLMMAVGNLIIAGLLYLAGLKCKKRGQIIGLYLILYAIGRFGIEFFRNDYRGAVGALSTSQFISIFMFAIGVAIFVWRTLAKEKEVAPEVVAEKKAVKKVKTEKVEKKEEVSEEVEKEAAEVEEAVRDTEG